MFLPHTSPASHLAALPTRAPAHAPGEGGRLARLYTTGRSYYGPKKKVMQDSGNFQKPTSRWFPMQLPLPPGPRWSYPNLEGH